MAHREIQPADRQMNWDDGLSSFRLCQDREGYFILQPKETRTYIVLVNKSAKALHRMRMPEFGNKLTLQTTEYE